MPASLDAELWEAFRLAVADVEAGWERGLEHAASRDEILLQLGELCRAVRAHAAGLAIPSEQEPRRDALARRLLSLLRASFLTRAQALPVPPPGDELLTLLQCIERVADACETTWQQRFSDRLSAPDGLELVVEIAHDIRSPLTSILFLAETLQRGRSGPLTPVQERQLGLVYSAAFGLSAVASDVIELARGGDRLVDLEPIPFSMRDILESVRDIVQPIAEEKGLAVRLVTAEPDFRVGHPVALSRVLLNLVTNALKFTSEGYVELAARALDGDRVEFSVRDTGDGIPPEKMATLYEPFRRRQKRGEYAFSGSGLGLSIVRKLVEAMGGRIEVETVKGEGTRFHFTLAVPQATPGA